MPKTLLTDGKIPAYMSCPFAFECELDKTNKCDREKVKDQTFSCGFARLFDLVYWGRDKGK